MRAVEHGDRRQRGDSVKLAAIRDALDRAGLAARTAVEVEVGPPKPYEAILEHIEAAPAPNTAAALAGKDDSSSDDGSPSRSD